MSLENRIEELLKESGKSVSELADYCKISRSAVYKWLSGGVKKMEPEIAELVGRFFIVNPDWVRTGEGSKHLYDKSSGDDEKIKLIEIIEAADRAMRDSGREFTKSERLENYFAALEFAGRQYFPEDFVEQYVEQLLKSKQKMTKE